MKCPLFCVENETDIIKHVSLPLTPVLALGCVLGAIYIYACACTIGIDKILLQFTSSHTDHQFNLLASTQKDTNNTCDAIATQIKSPIQLCALNNYI